MKRYCTLHKQAWLGRCPLCEKEHRKLFFPIAAAALLVTTPAQSQTVSETGPVLFRDLAYNETLPEIRARMKVDNYFGNYALDEAAAITDKCRASVWLDLSRKHKKLKAVRLESDCSDDALLTMRDRYGDPVLVSSQDYYSPRPLENLGDKYNGGIIGAIRRSVPNATRTTYKWIRQDGVSMTLITDSGNGTFALIYGLAAVTTDSEL